MKLSFVVDIKNEIEKLDKQVGKNRTAFYELAVKLEFDKRRNGKILDKLRTEMNYAYIDAMLF